MHSHFSSPSWWSKSEDWHSGDSSAGRPDFKMQIWCINALDASHTTTRAPEQSGRKEKECSVTQSRRVHQCTSRCTHCMHTVQSLVLIYAAQLYAKLFTKCIESHSDSSTIRDILGWCELQLKSNFEMVRNIWQRETILCWGCVHSSSACLLIHLLNIQ